MTDGHIALEREPTRLPEVLASALRPLIEQSAKQGIELRVIAADDTPAEPPHHPPAGAADLSSGNRFQSRDSRA